MLSFWYRRKRLCMMAASCSSASVDMSSTPCMLLGCIGQSDSLSSSARWRCITCHEKQVQRRFKVPVCEKVSEHLDFDCWTTGWLFNGLHTYTRKATVISKTYVEKCVQWPEIAWSKPTVAIRSLMEETVLVKWWESVLTDQYVMDEESEMWRPTNVTASPADIHFSFFLQIFLFVYFCTHSKWLSGSRMYVLW